MVDFDVLQETYEEIRGEAATYIKVGGAGPVGFTRDWCESNGIDFEETIKWATFKGLEPDFIVGLQIGILIGRSENGTGS